MAKLQIFAVKCCVLLVKGLIKCDTAQIADVSACPGLPNTGVPRAGG